MHNFNQPQENNVGLTISNARIKILNDWWNNINRPIEQNIETNKKYKIKIFADFGESLHFKHIFEQICETDKMENYGINKEIYIFHFIRYHFCPFVIFSFRCLSYICII